MPRRQVNAWTCAPGDGARPLPSLSLRVGCVFCWRRSSLRVCVRGSWESHGVRCLHSETDFEGRLRSFTLEA